MTVSEMKTMRKKRAKFKSRKTVSSKYGLEMSKIEDLLKKGEKGLKGTKRD